MGGGSSSYFPKKSSQLQALIRQTQEGTEQQRLDGDVNGYLRRLLVKLNDSHPEKVQDRIDEITGVLKEDHEVEKLLFGGSVAKHTFVDGLSDVDALVILGGKELELESPIEFLRSFLKALEGGLTHDEIATLDKGNLAVTVTYTDETEIQLLPALRRGHEIAIAESNGRDWKAINPKAFYRELTKANERLDRSLVPTIKLMKSILSDLPDDIRPTGYHVESLCLEATKGYRGPTTLKSVLLHALTASSALALHPIDDITNQSRHVDSYLGKRNSDQRVQLSRALAGIARRLNAATTIDRWKEIIEE
jgi:predicted nucleotidyltransferase